MTIDPNVRARVRKTGGDYAYEGFVVASFVKLAGAVRVVVEDERGLLLIMNPRQLETCPTAPEAGIDALPLRARPKGERE